MTVDQGSGRGSPPPDRSQSRFFCNRARTASLVCFILAFAALVIGGGFAEISTSGAPTALETAVVRWIILAALIVGFVAYYVGGRIRAGQTS
jgi:cation transporter-like permease